MEVDGVDSTGKRCGVGGDPGSGSSMDHPARLGGLWSFRLAVKAGCVGSWSWLQGCDEVISHLVMAMVMVMVMVTFFGICLSSWFRGHGHDHFFIHCFFFTQGNGHGMVVRCG